MKFPLPGDPDFVDHKGRLLTKDEHAAAEAFEKEHGSARQAADHYLQSLMGNGTVERATYLAEAPFQLTNGAPQKGTRMIFYQVRYVSKGGAVLDRKGYVIVSDRGDGYWFVSKLTHLQGIHFQ